MQLSQTPPQKEPQKEKPAAKPQPAAPGSGGVLLRRWLWIATAGTALLASAVAATVLLIPSDRIARAASAHAQAALGLPVEIGGVELRLWPTPTVVVENARMGPGQQPVVAVRRALLRPRILPLFSGRVSVSEITLLRPELRLEVDSAGQLNLPLSSGAAESEAGGGDIDFAVDRFRIRGGRLSYHDARDQGLVQLNGIEQELRAEGRVEEGQLARIDLDGTLSIASVDAVVPGKVAAPVRGVRFALTHAGSVDRAGDRLTLESLRVEIQRIALQGSGRVESLSDPARRWVDLELSTDEFSADDLARSFPAGFLPALLAGRRPGASAGPDTATGAASVHGRAAIQARVEGLATRDSLPHVDGTVRLSGVGALLRGREVLSGLEGTVAFSNEAVSTRGLLGRLFGEAFRIAFRVENFAAPVVSFATAGTARLEELASVAGTRDSVNASGRLPFDLQGRLHPTEPARSTLEGTVKPEDVRIVGTSLRQTVHIPGGQLRFAGEELRVEALRVEFGESRLRADATAESWLPAALGDSTRLPEVRFDVAASLLDLDGLLGASQSQYTPLLFARLADRPVNGRPAAEAAAAAGLALPALPRLNAQGRFQAGRLVRSGLEYRDADAQIELSPGVLSVPRARFGLMGGVVEMALALERGEKDADLAVAYKLANVGADSFFSKFTPFRGRLSGLLSLDGSTTLQLDEHMLPVRTSVQAGGNAAITDGWLAAWPVLRAAGERLGVERFDTLSFRNWSGAYQIAGPLVTLDRTRQSDGKVDTEVAGSFDFAGKLDLGVLAYLAPQFAASAAKPIQQAAASVSGNDGRVPVGLRITGSAAAPTIALDLKPARENALAQAREKAKQEVREAAQRAAQDVAQRVLPDSVKVRPDSVVTDVQAEVKNRLRGLLRRQSSTPTPPATPDSTAARDSAGTGGGR